MQEWTYLEDLALSKAQDSSEFQWLLRSKGMQEIEKRRKFLLTASGDQEGEIGDGVKIEEDAGITETDMQNEGVNYI